MEINVGLLHQITDMVRLTTLAEGKMFEPLVYILPKGNSISVAREMGSAAKCFLSTMAIDAQGNEGAVEGWLTQWEVAQRMITLAE